jgi:hypothetical protein
MKIATYEYQFKDCGTISGCLIGITTDEPIEDSEVRVR